MNFLHFLGVWGTQSWNLSRYKVVQIWPGQTVTCLHTISPGHIWTTLYFRYILFIISNLQSSVSDLKCYWVLCTFRKRRTSKSPELKSVLWNEKPVPSSRCDGLLHWGRLNRWVRADAQCLTSNECTCRITDLAYSTHRCGINFRHFIHSYKEDKNTWCVRVHCVLS